MLGFLVTGTSLNSMTSTSRIFSPVFFLLFSLTMIGCEETDTGTIDSTNTNPSVSSPGLSPDTVNVDSLTASNGLYTIQATGLVQASDADGDLSAVILRILHRDSSEPLSESSLHDDGISPDASAADGIFSGTVSFSLSRAETGPYRAQFVASDVRGLESNTLELTLFASRRNSSPTLDGQSLIAPDTVQRPSTGSTLVFMSIAAADSDGLADIKEVTLRNLDSQSQTKFFLLDDGGVISPTGVTSGDLLAGDGVFSIIIQIPSTIQVGLYRLAFQATDSFTDTSSTFIHNLIVE